MKKIGLVLWFGACVLAACGQAVPTLTSPNPSVPTPAGVLVGDTPESPLAAATTVAEPPAAPTATAIVNATAATAATTAPTATPSPTPAPVLKQLTQGKCCVQPFWSADSQRVLFLDKPDAQSQTGLYAVNVDSPATPQLVTPRVANYTNDMQYSVSFDGAVTVVERVANNQPWRISTGGRNVMLSPDRTRVLWNVTPETLPFENRVTTVMLATLGQGGRVDPKKLTTILRGGAMAWLDDGRVLMSARRSAASQLVTLFIYTLADGSTVDLAQSERLRGVVPAPGGNWVAYTIAFDKKADQNGTWAVRSDGTASHKLNFFGAFQWRDPEHLVYVPLELNVASHAFYEYNVVTNTTRPLTDPSQTAFRIANGDWAISPDGRKIVFLNEKDLNLWLLPLP